jgi:hypothetical protein
MRVSTGRGRRCGPARSARDTARRGTHRNTRNTSSKGEDSKLLSTHCAVEKFLKRHKEWASNNSWDMSRLHSTARNLIPPEYIGPVLVEPSEKRRPWWSIRLLVLIVEIEVVKPTEAALREAFEARGVIALGRRASPGGVMRSA